MPRLPRIYIEGALYYITCEGDYSRNLFNDENDYEAYLELLGKYKKELGFKLFAFVLLPKQLHLLIELNNNVTISTIMHNINSNYTKFFNSRYDKKGHLFQSRFKAVLIEKQEFLARLTRYIHLNPKRIGLVKEAKEYGYSSFGLYLNSARNNFIDMREEISEVLNQLQKINSQNSYEDFVNSIEAKEKEEMYRMLHYQAYVGSKDFMSAVKKKMDEAQREEEKVLLAHPARRAFIFAGCLAIIILGIITFRLYKDTLSMRGKFTTAVDVYNKRIQLMRKQIAVSNPQKEIKKDLNNSLWEVELMLVDNPQSQGPNIDRLGFQNGQFTSEILSVQGYPPSNYSVTIQEDGTVVWETMQTKEDGTTATWYGVWQEKTMKGLLSERPAQGESRDFSFVSRRCYINGS